MTDDTPERVYCVVVYNTTEFDTKYNAVVVFRAYAIMSARWGILKIANKLMQDFRLQVCIHQQLADAPREEQFDRVHMLGAHYQL